MRYYFEERTKKKLGDGKKQQSLPHSTRTKIKNPALMKIPLFSLVSLQNIKQSKIQKAKTSTKAKNRKL